MSEKTPKKAKMVNWDESTVWSAIDEIHKMYFSFPKEGEKYNGFIILKHVICMTVVMGFYFYGIIAFIFNAYKG